jgi:hypothetical protein
MCKEGGFGVYKYDDSRLGARGILTVYGGIVNEIRNAVGTFSTQSSTGYKKNYIFDRRFVNNPPPNYPRVTNQLQWTEWQG